MAWISTIKAPKWLSLRALPAHAALHNLTAYLVDVDDESVVDQCGPVGLEGEGYRESRGAHRRRLVDKRQREVVSQRDGGQHRALRPAWVMVRPAGAGSYGGGGGWTEIGRAAELIA